MLRNNLHLKVFVLLFAIAASSQSQEWVWQNPLPQGNDLNQVQFVNDSIGWAMGNVLLHTTDGGKTWKNVSVAMNETRIDLTNFNLSFIDEVHGWLTNGDKLFKTTNSGVKWEPSNFSFEDRVNKVKFISPKIGWVTHGMDFFSITTDGGESWIKRRTEGMNYRRSLHFVDALSGWSCFGDDTLRKTTDGGISWIPVHWNSSQGYETYTFLDARNGWIVTPRETMRTTDGGITWLTYPQNDYVYPRMIKFVDENHGWMISNASNISHSTDGGITWKTIQKQPNFDDPLVIGDIQFISPTRGWIVGKNGLTKSTTDGGFSWNTVSTGPTCNFTEVAFADTNKGWVLSSNIVLHTGNGGKEWDTLFYNSDERKQMFSHLKISNSTIRISSITGTGYVSYDGGKKWIKQGVPDRNYNINLIDYFDPSNGWAVGKSGTILHTSDSGSTWQEQFSGTNKNLSKIMSFSKNCAVLTGVVDGYYSSINLLLFTTDGGENWERMEENELKLSLPDAKLHNRETQFGSYYITEFTSGRVTITKQKESEQGNRRNIMCSVGEFTWMIEPNQAIIYFMKNGSKEGQTYPMTANRLNAMTFVNERNGWIVGEGGTILHYGFPSK